MFLTLDSVFLIRHPGESRDPFLRVTDLRREMRTWTSLGPGFRRYRIHRSLARYVSAERRPYTSRPRSGDREGPIAKQWEGEGRPCYLFLRRAAEPHCRHFHAPPLVQPSAAPRDRAPLTLPTLTRWAPPSPRCRGARCIGDRRTRRQRCATICLRIPSLSKTRHPGEGHYRIHTSQQS